MAVTVPKRPSGGVEPGSRILPRTARPLNGQEIAQAIKSHLSDLCRYLLGRHGMPTNDQQEFITSLLAEVDLTTQRNSRLNKLHVRYPKVGWNLKVRLEDDEPQKALYLSADCELDLARNVRLVLQFGESGKGNVIDTVEDERLSTGAPDAIREQFDLPVEVQVVRPDGQVGTVNLHDVMPKRAARKVDVGSASTAVEAEVATLIEVVTPEVSEMALEAAQVHVAEPVLDLEPPVVEVAPAPVPAPKKLPNAKMGVKRK